MKTLAVAAAILASAASARDLDANWRAFSDPRFGVALDFPEVFSRREAEADKSEGETFRTPDGSTRLTIYGRYDAGRRSAAELLQAYKTPGVTYAYAQSARDWFVLSGSKAQAIGYMRCNIGPSGVVGCFEIQYPSAEAARWAPVVERLSRSLRLSPPAAAP